MFEQWATEVAATGESPDNRKARGYAQIGSADVGSVTSLTPIDEEDQRIVKSALLDCDITEVFSPARVTRACKPFGLIPGESFDLRTGYDLSDADV